MNERHADSIIRYLALHGSITHGNAERMLHVSPVTVRRLFRALAENHRAIRVHGGLRAFSGSAGGTIPVSQREFRQPREKELLAQRVLGYLDAERLNMIHGGTTTQYLSKYITSGCYLTDSVFFADALNRRFPNGDGPALVVTGGILNMKAGFLYGPKAQAVVRSYVAAVLVTSVRGCDAAGLLETDEHSTGMIRNMMLSAEKTIVVADHRKFHIKGNCRLAGWKEIDLLVTTENAGNADFLKRLQDQGVQVDIIPQMQPMEGDSEE